MSGLAILAACGLGISGLALVQSLKNLRAIARCPDLDREALAGLPRLTVCIPARNEAGNIGACIESILAGDHPDLRVVVYDDGSDDGTGEIVEAIAARDPRVALCPAVERTPEWNGKQHGCYRCAEHALAEDGAGWLLFVDADVRLERTGASRAHGDAMAKGVGVLSVFPRQITGTLWESVVVPMIFFILYSYLPVQRMRRTLSPSASAACGQFILVSGECYRAFGGHSAFAGTMHDGVKLPRAARRAGFGTDLSDGTDVARVRMYEGFAQTWRGFTKNAYEGLGSPVLLVFLTVMHGVGHLAPPIVLVLALLMTPVDWLAAGLALGAMVVAVEQRVVLSRALKTKQAGALLHPLGVLLMTLIQWRSLWLHVTGQRSWRGRAAGG